MPSEYDQFLDNLKKANDRINELQKQHSSDLVTAMIGVLQSLQKAVDAAPTEQVPNGGHQLLQSISNVAEALKQPPSKENVAALKRELKSVESIIEKDFKKNESQSSISPQLIDAGLTFGKYAAAALVFFDTVSLLSGEYPNPAGDMLQVSGDLTLYDMFNDSKNARDAHAHTESVVQEYKNALGHIVNKSEPQPELPDNSAHRHDPH